MSDTTPSATGSLAATPMAHLLVYALDKQLNGSLVLETPEGAKSAILFVNGRPAKAKMAQPVVRIGDLLVELGWLSELDHAASEALVPDRSRRYGQLLLERGMISAEALQEGLEEQVARRVLWAFTLPPDTVYGYYDARDFLERWGAEPTPVDSLAVLGRGVRDHGDPARIDQTLERLGSRSLRLHLDSKVGRFGLLPREQAVADVLRLKPQSYRALVDSEIADLTTIRRVVYLLCITRHLDLGAAPVGIGTLFSRPPSNSLPPLGSEPPPVSTGAPVRSASPAPVSGAPATPRPGPSSSAAAAGWARRALTPATRTRTPTAAVTPSLPAELLALRAELLDFARMAPDLNYYELLGAKRGAATLEIQNAFFQLAKKWHPDRLPAGLSELRDLVTRTFARMTEASQVLLDEQRRRAYDDVLDSGKGQASEEEQVQRVLRAATAFQKARVLVRSNNLAAAELEAEQAMNDDPDQGEYRALHAWIVAQNPAVTPARLNELIASLDKALQREEKNERILFYRAQLHKRAGNPEAAYRDFRAVLEQNPQNVDAAREVRLYRMRRPTSSTPPPREGKGPLGKFFKR